MLAGFASVGFLAIHESTGEWGEIQLREVIWEGCVVPIAYADPRPTNVDVAPGGPDSTGPAARQLEAELERRRRPQELMPVWLNISPRLATGDALALLDSALRAGATHVGYVDPVMADPGLRKWRYDDLLRLPTCERIHLRINGVALDGRDPAGSPTPTLSDRALRVTSPWFFPDHHPPGPPVGAPPSNDGK
jgi:hypothetical protein